jgi:hypothetical protein
LTPAPGGWQDITKLVRKPATHHPELTEPVEEQDNDP